MSESHSTAPIPTDKPDQLQPPATRARKPQKLQKPYPEFPLTAHPAGYWCKKILGKLHYFGPWDDPDAALAKYLGQKDALHAGRSSRPPNPASTVSPSAAVTRFRLDASSVPPDNRLGSLRPPAGDRECWPSRRSPLC
jgi:hypothetical protein